MNAVVSLSYLAPRLPPFPLSYASPSTLLLPLSPFSSPASNWFIPFIGHMGICTSMQWSYSGICRTLLCLFKCVLWVWVCGCARVCDCVCVCVWVGVNVCVWGVGRYLGVDVGVRIYIYIYIHAELHAKVPKMYIKMLCHACVCGVHRPIISV